jgi:hypothetical protein
MAAFGHMITGLPWVKVQARTTKPLALGGSQSPRGLFGSHFIFLFAVSFY